MFLYEATSGFAARYGPSISQPAACRPSDFLVPLLLDTSRRHAGDRATRLLGSSSGVGSFHPTRNAPLHGAHKVVLTGC